MLKAPGAPTGTGRTTIGTLARLSGDVGVSTKGSFAITHRYLGPPDPDHPTNKIHITASVVDDNNGSTVEAFVDVSNPGITTFNVAIDTTPDVPRLELPAQPPALVLLDQQSAAPSSQQAATPVLNRTESTTASDLYFELVVVSPDGKESEPQRLGDDALIDLRGLFVRLPDNQYRIYLKRTDTNSRRLVIDVFVRHGRVIDPSDESEGARDRPAAAEGVQQIKAQQNKGEQIIAPPVGGPQQQAVPLQNNPFLNDAPDVKAGAANGIDLPAIGPADNVVERLAEDLNTTLPARSRASMRWALPLAGLGLVANRESWSKRLGDVLETADERAWQRLRCAGRLGKSGQKSTAGQGKESAMANEPS
jgi:hypothetical protein